MKILLPILTLGLSLTLVATCCWAKPFLICSPEPNADSCIVDVDGTEFSTPYPLHYDMVGVAIGDHTVKVKFVNALWGDSGWSSPLDFTKPSLGDPSGLGLQAD